MTKRVLVATVGTTPQVLAETLWALESIHAWTPHEIFVVTTGRGREAVLRAYEERQLGPALKAPPEIIVPNVSGSNAQDVDSSEATQQMANTILRLLARLTADPATELHVSISGGRKTTSADAALAAALVCRPQDRVSHVLVSPSAYEDNSTFWRPDQIEPCYDKENNKLDPAKAKVTLIDVPTPLLRYSVEQPESLATLDFRQVVAELNAARAAGRVVLHVGSNSVEYGARLVKLKPLHFALFRFIATARLENWQGAGPAGTGPEYSGWISYRRFAEGSRPVPDLAEIYIGYIEQAGGQGGRMEASTDAIRRCFAELKPTGDWRRKTHDPVLSGEIRRLLSYQLTRLREELNTAFGRVLSNQLCPAQVGRGEGLRFGLDLPSSRIEIRL